MKLLVILFFIFSTDAFAINTPGEGYEIPAGGNLTITVHGVCRKVTNLTTLKVFAPTKTSPEWLAFISNTPTNVVAASCCSGYQYNSYCYYTAAFEENCTTFCSLKGGCIASGISHAAIPTAAICQNIITATTGVSSFTVAATEPDSTGYPPGDTLGCLFYDGRLKGTPYSAAVRMWSNLAPNCNTTAEGYGRRVCACGF